MLTTLEGERIVITGAECITGLGMNRAQTLDAALRGETAVRDLRDELVYVDRDLGIKFPYDVHVAAPILGFTDEVFKEITGIKKGNVVNAIHRSNKLGVAAVALALHDAGLTSQGSMVLPEGIAERMAIVMGSGSSGTDAYIDISTMLHAYETGEHGTKVYAGMLPNPGTGLSSLFEQGSSRSARLAGMGGPSESVVAACASSSIGAINIIRMILLGEVNIGVAAASESTMTPEALAIFAGLGALSKSRDPRTASRPFDVNRDGFVMGEAGAAIVIEAESHARERGAKILSFVGGYGHNTDRSTGAPTEPNPEGTSAAMLQALSTLNEELRSRVAIKAHATSTPRGDEAELAAIRMVADKGVGIAGIFSLKGSFAHGMGASGLSELAAGIEAEQRGVLPFTVNLADPDPAAEGMPLIMNEPIEIRSSATLYNSFGFGGMNGELVTVREEEL